MLRPISRAFSTKRINDRWGRAIFEVSVIGLIRRDAKAVGKLDVILNDGAVGLIAMARNQSLAQFYSHIGALADSQGYKAAHQFVREATTPYIISGTQDQLPKYETPYSEAQNSEAQSSEAQNSETRILGAQVFKAQSWEAQSLEAQISGPHISGMPDATGPVAENPNSAIRFDPEEMNLFDSETWLRDSPIAQQKWKE